jgi:hypothetical protein
LAVWLWDKNLLMAKIASPGSSMTSSTPTHDEIAAQAYQIYLREGCAEGRDLDHWLRAEMELRERTNGNGHAEPTERPISSARVTARTETPPVLPNSVVPANAPIAQVTRGTTAKRNSGKREAAVAK